MARLNPRGHPRATDASNPVTGPSDPIIANAPDMRADTLAASYERAGYARVTPAMLQPAEPFLDLSGEDIRRRMYFVTDAAGRDLCLRPDLTIPVALDYLASDAAGSARNFCYHGPVFRQPREEKSASGHRYLFNRGTEEVQQAGIESFGRADTAAADAETLALALDAASHFGVKTPTIRTGDVALFAALLAALKLPPAWVRRLAKDFNRKRNLAQDLDRLFVSQGNGRPEYQGVLTALANSDLKGARALVTDLLSIAGISAVGGRSVGEIADRFLEQAELGAANSLPQEKRALIERYLGIAGDPDDAAAQLRALAADAGLDLGAALDLFESRTGFLAARGVDLGAIAFATAFGRGLDYYTGFVFEVLDPDGRTEGPLAAGGRYDGLLAGLSDRPAIPAVGFAAWIERLAACGGKP